MHAKKAKTERIVPQPCRLRYSGTASMLWKMAICDGSRNTGSISGIPGSGATRFDSQKRSFALRNYTDSLTMLHFSHGVVKLGQIDRVRWFPWNHRLPDCSVERKRLGTTSKTSSRRVLS